MGNSTKEKVALHTYEKAKKASDIMGNIGASLMATVLLGCVGVVFWGAWNFFTWLATTTVFWPVTLVIVFIAVVITVGVLQSHFDKIIEQGDTNGVIDE